MVGCDTFLAVGFDVYVYARPRPASDSEQVIPYVKQTYRREISSVIITPILHCVLSSVVLLVYVDAGGRPTLRMC